MTQFKCPACGCVRFSVYFNKIVEAFTFICGACKRPTPEYEVYLEKVEAKCS